MNCRHEIYSRSTRTANLGGLLSLAAIAAMLSAFFCSTAAQADSDSSAAVALYNRQQYAAALQAFSAIVDKNPNNTTALYYSANCDVGLGKTSAAISIYKHLVDAFPSSAEAASAGAVLVRMGIRYGAPVSTTAKSAGKADSVHVASVSKSKAGPAGEKSDVINQIVVPVRALAGRPEVTSQTIDSIKSALKVYPTPLLAILNAQGLKVFITPTMIDKEPQLVNTQPSGYEDGSTFRNCPGMFNGNVVLCENRFIGDGPDLAKCPDIVGTLRHELGHAVDWYLGELTKKDEFKHQYLLDLGTIDDGTKSNLSYFCQKDFRGPSETFAEIMCLKYGGRPSNNERTALVGSSFKLTSAYVDKMMAKVDGGN